MRYPSKIFNKIDHLVPHKPHLLPPALHALLIRSVQLPPSFATKPVNKKTAREERVRENKMASLTMMASFLGTSRPSIGHHRSVVVTTAAARAQDAAAKPNHYEARGDNENSGRRGVVFAAAAAAVCAIGQGIATAQEEPKPGTPEAKKKYAPICVTMPTAKICHK